MQRFFTFLLCSVSLSCYADFECHNGTAAQEVLMQRDKFNRAIVNANIDDIKSVLATNVTLVTGSDSLLFNGEQEQLDVWAEDFTKPNERLIYHRQTACVNVNPAGNMAMELGHWTGKDKQKVRFKGNYTAKWRLNSKSNGWELEAEIFMTKETL